CAKKASRSRETKCLGADGTPERSEARARPMDPALPSVLKITTVHMLGIWWYPFGRESIVVARGPDRRWLAVGHPSLHYARILAHSPALSDDDLKSAAAALAAAQFDISAMELHFKNDRRE